MGHGQPIASARRPLAEAGLAALAAAVTGLAVHALIAAIGIDARSPVAPGLGPVWAGAMIAVALVAWALQARGARWAVAALAGVAAGVAMAPLIAGLHGTAQPLYTVTRGDMTFRTEYVTRFASTWALDDYTFRGLGAFYPPAWFWLAGRAARLLDIEPWRIVKPFSIGTVAVSLLAAWSLWRRVLTPAGALAAAVGSVLVLTRQEGPLGAIAHSTQGWYSPYSCFVAVTGAAWVAATLAAASSPGRRRGQLAALAAFGALLALAYYLLFALLALVLVGLAALPAAGRRRTLRGTLSVLAAITALTAVFWVPLAAAVLGGAAGQGHYLAPDFLSVAVGLDGPPALVVLAVAAATALAATAGWPAARAVAGVLVGAVAYQLASVASLVATDSQLQPHRAVTLLWATLGAAVPVALDGARRRGTLAAALPAPTARAARAAIASLTLPAAFVLGAGQGADLAAGPLTLAAHDPVDMRQPAAIGDWIAATARRAPEQLTIASDDPTVLAIRPFFGFVALGAHYAHPRARQAERVAVLERAAGCASARCVTRTLSRTPFGPVDALVLRRVPLGFALDAQVDAFPLPRAVRIVLAPSHLDPRVWARARFGEYEALVRRPGAQAAAGAR